MRLVFLVLCVVLVSGDELPKIADGGGPSYSEAAASEQSQWAPFFNEASRASEGLPWSSMAPELVSDHQSAATSRQETYPKPQSAASSHHEAYSNVQSFERGDSSSTKPSEERKDVHKVTITKKIRVPYTVHVEKHIPKIIEVPVDKPFNVYVPKPYPVIVEKKVPYEIKVAQPQPYTVEKRVPYPVKVLVDKPYTLHVPRPYPVDVEKKYEFTVEKKVPYEVKVPVERPYPVHVIVEKEVKFPVEKKVPVPVKVPYEKPIPIHVTKHVPVDVDKPVPYTVEKVATYPVKVPFRIPIKMHYPEGGSVEEVHGDVQNFEWVEAMNKATRAAKLESRPAQWHGSSHGLSLWQGEPQTPLRWHADSQKLSLGPGDAQKQSQWHAESVGPSQFRAESFRPSQRHELTSRPNNVRQGFSAGRGLPTRNGYLLGKHVHKRPTTKLQPVGHLYEVNEAQFEQPPMTPFLNRPGSEVIVPQMILAHSPPNIVGLQQSSPPSHGLQQSSSLRSGPPQSNPQYSGLELTNYLKSGTQGNPSANPSGGSQQGSVPLVFSNSIPSGGFTGPVNDQQPFFVNHQNNTSGTASFSITNVIHHAGTPSHQTIVNHRAPSVLSGKPNSLQGFQYLTHNSLGSESAQLPSATFFKPAQNTSKPAYGTKTVQHGASLENTPQTPFGTSGFTISFHSPPLTQRQPHASSPQQSQAST